MTRYVRFGTVFHSFVVVALVVVGVGAPEEPYAPPPVTAAVAVEGPIQQGGGGGRVATTKSIFYWTAADSDADPRFGVPALAGVPCNPATGETIPGWVQGDPIPPEFLGRAQLVVLMNRISGSSTGEYDFYCAAPGAGITRVAAPSVGAVLSSLTATNLAASEPSFSPSRRALTGMEFRVWGTDTGPIERQVSSTVEGWSVVATVRRSGYTVSIRDVEGGALRFEQTVSDLGTAEFPGVRYLFEDTGRVVVTVTTTWEVTSSVLRGTPGTRLLSATVEPLGTVALVRQATFDVIQIRGALTTGSAEGVAA